MMARYVLLGAARDLIVRCMFKYQLLFQIWDYLFRTNRIPWYFWRSCFEYCFCVLFLMNSFKYKHFRSTLYEKFHLVLPSSFIVSISVLNSRSSHFVFLGAHGIFRVSPSKKYVLVFFLLNSTKEEYSRFISCEQLRFMVPVSFLCRSQI